MTHPRQAIREAVVAALRWKTKAQDRVYATRFVPWAQRDLPAIAVYTLSETAEEGDFGGASDRHLALAVAAVVSAGGEGNVDNQLDALALEIETALRADATIGGSAASSSYTGTTIEPAEEAGRLFAAAQLTFDVQYTAQAA